jgi:hypothetical protein
MADPGGESPEEGATGTGIHGDAWAATIEDMRATAEDLEANGWNVLTLTPGDTSVEAPDDGESDRFGLVYVVGDGDGDAFESAHEAGTFPRYEVYRGERAGRVFLVTVLLDPETETAVLLAGTYEREEAAGCLRAAAEEGTMYTHLHTLDGTHLGSFEHERYEKFFSDGLLEEAASAGNGEEVGDAENAPNPGTNDAGDTTNEE